MARSGSCGSICRSIRRRPACTQSLDVDGNLVTVAWFNELHDRMVIRATSEVETLRENPYDYLVTPLNRRLADRLSALGNGAARPALRRTAVPIHVDPARELAEQLRGASRGEVVPFLVAAHRNDLPSLQARSSRARFALAARDDDRTAARRLPRPGRAVDRCLPLGRRGRPVRQRLLRRRPLDHDKHYLHAWAEVYLPGAGWRGFDPTNGLAVADRHVAVAAAADPQHAAPVTATYRGNNVEAELYADVVVETTLGRRLLRPAKTLT